MIETNSGNGGHRSRGSPVPDVATTAQPGYEPRDQPHPPIAAEANVLDRVYEVLEAAGVVGVGRLVRLLYLVVTSRVFGRPVSVAIKGPSAGGKSFVLEQVLKLFPERAFYLVTAMSERALAYGTDPLDHRMLVLPEAAGMTGDFQTYLIRSLLSEGQVRYETVEKTPDGLRSRLIERKGPTGLLTTTTRATLHPENETRLLSVTVADTRDQTRAVLRAQARQAKPAPDLTPWHSFQDWIVSHSRAVHVPFAEQLADMVSADAVRIRRDFPLVLTLIRAHALLHQLSRPTDAEGRIVATFDDYTAVRTLVADLVAEGIEATVSPATRETVDAVRALLSSKPPGATVTVQDIASALGMHKSSVSRRCKVALQGGFLVDEETKRGSSKQRRLRLGQPLPEEPDVLPTVERLRGGCAVAEQTEGSHPSDEAPLPVETEPSEDDG